MEDAVTGAWNMSGFGMNFAKAIAMGRTDKTALWYIDIRNFRSINPNFGFLKGNEVLRTMVSEIREYLAHDLPVARLGADRIVLLSEKMDFGQVTDAFHDMAASLGKRLKEIGVTQSIVLTGGIYYLRQSDFDSRSFSQALDYASIAHRNAKRDPSTSLVLFTDDDLERDNRRITIEQSINEALATGQIEVWYQPQVDYTYGDVIGAEALARWNHPTLGWISPAEFIPVLEKAGRVHDLDIFVWEEACRNAGRWRNVSDGKPVPISVNVSRAEMFEEGLMEHFLELQKKYDLPDGSLHIEVTESAFVEEADRLYGIIEEMRTNKMMVEMDDFGSGLSSLHMLKDVPVDVVKLDMGFMRTAVNEERGGVVLSSVIRMLQGLDTPIIAEGVETLEQAEMLKNMGCHLMQGFHFSRPMPLGEFEDFIQSNNTVESTDRRSRKESRLEELMSFDPTSSFLFNEAIGGMMLFQTDGSSSESIMVNDAFYEDCGLKRDQFGNTKVNPIQEIDPQSRETLWRAAAEARENGSAVCTAQVRLTGRWIECVMRYISSSPRGHVFSLNVIRSGFIDEGGSQVVQVTQDADWNLEMLSKIVPSGFVKCALDESFTIDYISPDLIEKSGLAHDEFMRRYHNSLLDVVVFSDRTRVMEAVRDSAFTGAPFDIDFNLYYGFGGEMGVQALGRVAEDERGEKWLYALVLVKNMGDEAASGTGSGLRTIPFDYFLEEDRLVVHAPLPDGGTRDIEFTKWLDTLDSLPDHISASSAAKVIATVRDLRHHPLSGFSDIKCNLRGGESLRWYHINYVCEADDEGNTKVMHGYAQDANDQMGSAKWWRRQAEIDYLTGLLNRNAVEQEINTAMRAEGSGMMFMIDLDNFKRVNDELGHLTGDALLRDVADVLSSHFRDTDVLGRYGGDEFVAFMPASPEDARDIAAHRAADIVAAVGAIEVPDGSHAACSIGIALSKSRDATFYDLLEVADQALYQSKENGKGVYTLLDMNQS